MGYWYKCYLDNAWMQIVLTKQSFLKELKEVAPEMELFLENHSPNAKKAPHFLHNHNHKLTYLKFKTVPSLRHLRFFVEN